MIELKNISGNIIQVHTHEFQVDEKIEVDRSWATVDSVIQAISNLSLAVLVDSIQIESISDQIKALQGSEISARINNSVLTYPFGDKKFQGKNLFMRVTGLDPQEIDANQEHVFTYDIPYTHCKITCAEIVKDVSHQADLEVHHPTLGMLNRFGKDVCMGEVYKRESYYDADLFEGLQVKVRVKNKSSNTIKFGVNLILHEVKE